jgi:hypothetical protein
MIHRLKRIGELHALRLGLLSERRGVVAQFQQGHGRDSIAMLT